MQTQFFSKNKLAALAILVASTSCAFAQSAGDTVVSAGWFHIVPQDSSTPITVISPNLGPLVGSGATAKNVDTVGASVTRFVTDNWAVGFDLGIPPTYKLNGTGTFAPIGRIGTAKQWAPTVLAKYFFGGANAQFRPSLGLGLTHVNYTDIQLTDNFEHAVGSRFLDPSAVTTAELESSWAPVFNAGLSYAIDKKWSVNFSVSYVKLDTTANLTTKAGALSALSTSTLTLNPIVTYLNVGYRF